MITKKFDKLIKYLATCNGTTAHELQKRIDLGEISEEEAVYVHIYAALKRLHQHVDTMVGRYP